MADFTKDVCNDDELFIVFESNSSKTKNERHSKVLSKKRKNHKRRWRKKYSNEIFMNNYTKSNVVSCKPNSNSKTSRLGISFSPSRPNTIQKSIVHKDTIDGNDDNSGSCSFKDGNENYFLFDEHIVIDSVECSESSDEKVEIKNLQNTAANNNSDSSSTTASIVTNCKNTDISDPLNHESESCTGSGIITSKSNAKKHKISKRDQTFMSSIIDEEVTVVPGDDSFITEKLSRGRIYETDPKRIKKKNLKSTPEIFWLGHNKEDILNGPLINVTFKSRKLAEKYRLKIEQFLKELLANEDLSISEDSRDQEDEEGGQLQFFQDFYVDTLQHALDKISYVEQNRLPLYDKNYREILKDKKTEGNPQNLKLKLFRPTFTCFNCMGNHLLDKCREKHDKRIIAKNRKAYIASSPMSKARYHQEEKGKSFAPGVIGAELQRALDLRPNQLPPYIYRMRILGYPPGWLKEAEIKSSGLMLYGSDGKAIHHDENIEDGEVDLDSMKGLNAHDNQMNSKKERKRRLVQYDPVKLVDYPGFNIPVPRGFIDESKHLRMPSLQFHQLRQTAKHTVRPMELKPHVKRKFSESSKIKTKELKIDRQEDNMEVDDSNDGKIIDSDDDESNTCKFIPPLPPDEPRGFPPPPPDDPPNTLSLPSSLPPSKYSGTDDQGIATSSQMSSQTISPSLTDMEESKKKFMQKLDEVSNKTDLENRSNLNDKISFDDIKSPFAAENRYSLQCDSGPGESKGFKEMTFKKNHSRSLSVSSGTPVLRKFSSFTSIPDPSKFKSGVSEHLPFENLSNSTGMYDKMRHVLRKVKQKLQQL